MKNTKQQIPVEKNKHYIIHIHDLGTRAEGIGKVDDFTIFVEKALPGDKIEARIIKVKKNFAFGKLINVIEPSSLRQEPKCPVAGQCGGCQLQHMTYEGQLNYKTKKVQDVLERIGKIEGVRVKPTLGMENPYGYRNKAQFPVRKENGQLKIGFFAPRSHRIIDTNTCDIQHKSNTQIIARVRGFLEDYNISIYDEKEHKGLVRHIVTKVGFKTHELMVCMVINGDVLPHSEILVEKLKAISGMTSIVINHNKAKGNMILGPKITTVYGEAVIRDYIGDVQFEISPLSFFQVNPMQTKVLYEKVLEFAQLTGEETVWDAYCGIGSISLFLAKQAKMVYGVEIVPEAIKDARRNAVLNEIENVEFIVGLAEEVIPRKFKEEGIKADVVVVDPPRKGCDGKLLEAIVEIGPESIVYVSCDPGTLARDLKYLVGNGYRVMEVQPVDMFPMTGHVETIALIQRQTT